MESLVLKADIFAMAAHAAVGQMRNYSEDTPYIVHPREVAQILASFGARPVVQVGGLLHDVVEDTKVSLDLIRAEFGEEACDLVRMVTNVAKPEDGNRAARALINLKHKANASPEGQDIVMADVISNLKDLALLKPSFAKVYVPEKHAVVEALGQGNPKLRERARQVIGKAAEHLGIHLANV